MIKALLLENQDGKTAATLTRLAESQLPAGEVRVAANAVLLAVACAASCANAAPEASMRPRKVRERFI